MVKEIKDPISQSLSIIVSSLLVVSQSMYGLPQGGVVTSGNSNITHNGNTTTVNQSSAKTTINWQSFNINANETVNFVQPNKNAIALNRVVGNERSVISGALNANGQVWLLNSNGILFNNSASINTSGFLATTKQLSDDAFNNGNYTFTHNSTADIINLGTIHVNNKGYVAMLGNHVRNEGTIEVVQGVVNMISAEEVSISFNGNSLVEFVINKASLDAIVENFGVISNNKGEVYLQAQGLNEVFKGVVNNEGIIEAQSVQDITSKVILDSNGNVLNSGTINVSNATGVGGEIRLLGDNNAINTGDLLARGLEGGFVAIASANVQANNFNVLAMDNSEENMGWYYTKENVNYGRSMESPLLSKSGTLSDTPILFNANEGQFSNGVSFGAMGSEYSVALSAAQAAMYFSGNGDVAGIQFVNANDNVQAVGLDKKSSYSNYYIGGNSVERVADYGKVKYENVYDDVDLVYYTNKAGKIEHDLIVRAHGDTSNIAYDYGDSTATLQANGDIEVRSGDATLTQKAPLSYQKTNRGKSIVGSNYTMDDEGIARINIQDAYDTSSDLIIDPVLQWTTDIMGNDYEIGYHSKIQNNHLYTVGHTYGTAGIVTDGSSHSGGGLEGFMQKTDLNGNRVWATYFGGSGSDSLINLAVDNSGIYTVGSTTSSDLLTTNSGNGQQGFIAKFDFSGTKQWDTSISGIGNESINDLKLFNNKIYIVGHTSSIQLEVNAVTQASTNDLSRTNSNTDVFIAVLNGTGAFQNILTFGGTNIEQGLSIDVDNNYIYIGGTTTSTTLPNELTGVTNSVMNNVFVAQFDHFGTNLWSRIIGNGIHRSFYGDIQLYNGQLHVTGDTHVIGLHTQGNDNAGGRDSFLTRLDTSGNIDMFVYHGGSGADEAERFDINANGIYIVGKTQSSGLDSSSETSYRGSTDSFLMKILHNGTLDWFRYLGMSGGVGVTLHNQDIYTTGMYFQHTPTHLSDIRIQKFVEYPTVISPIITVQNQNNPQVFFMNRMPRIAMQQRANSFNTLNTFRLYRYLQSAHELGLSSLLLPTKKNKKEEIKDLSSFHYVESTQNTLYKFYKQYKEKLEKNDLLEIQGEGVMLPEKKQKKNI